MARLTPERPQLQISYRMVRPDGSMIWVERNSRAYFDEHGALVRVIGMVADVTERRSAQEALLRSEAELSEAQRLASVGSWQWDPKTDHVTWSRELYRIAGRDPELPAPSYKEHSELYAPDSAARLQRAVHDAMQNSTPYQLDLQMIRGDGSLRWVTARGEARRDDSGRIVGLRGTAHDITERKRAEDALSSVGQRLIEAQEHERTRIARDLHDDIGQQLSLLAVELDHGARRRLQAAAGRGNARIDDISMRAREILSKVGSISHELHSSKLEYLGLMPAMRGFCKESRSSTSVEVVFSGDGLPPSIARDTSLCLFRVLQEALHNAVRHSQVTRFEVLLRGSADAISLTVADRGVGFDPAATIGDQGLGLISMQERLKAVQGSLSIESRPSIGTTIRARVPLDSPAEAAHAARRAQQHGAGASLDPGIRLAALLIAPATPGADAGLGDPRSTKCRGARQAFVRSRRRRVCDQTVQRDRDRVCRGRVRAKRFHAGSRHGCRRAAGVAFRLHAGRDRAGPRRSGRLETAEIRRCRGYRRVRGGLDRREGRPPGLLAEGRRELPKGRGNRDGQTPQRSARHRRLRRALARFRGSRGAASLPSRKMRAADRRSGNREVPGDRLERRRRGARSQPPDASAAADVRAGVPHERRQGARRGARRQDSEVPRRRIHHMLFKSKNLYDIAPPFAAYLEQFPGARLDNSEQFLFWAKNNLTSEGQSISLHQLVVYKAPGGNTFVADKLLFANRDVDAALALISLAPSADGNSFWTLVGARARTTLLSGMTARMLRGTIERGTRDTVKMYLDWVRGSMAGAR